MRYSDRSDAGQEHKASRLSAASALARAVEAHDPQTGSHSESVGELAARVALWLGLQPEEAALVRLAGSLHDLGKLAIPEEILRKPGPLDEEERALIERHPDVGAQMLDPLDVDPLPAWVRHHHERWDGSGYPAGLGGEAIPLAARILHAVDAYDAMTTDRPYRKALSCEEALDELERGAGAQFDPDVVDAILANVYGTPRLHVISPPLEDDFGLDQVAA